MTTFEPLPPLYTPRRTSNESSSIRSEAPSYHSTVPQHHTILLSTPSQPPPPAPPARPTGLPPIPPSLSSSRGSSLSIHQYSQPWTTFSAPQTRQYQSVAARRHERAASSSQHKSLITRTHIRNPVAESTAVSPQEDPHLVGEVAATEARNRRLLMSRMEGEEVLRREDEKWDFLLAQMQDWEERQRSWGVFRSRVETRQKKRQSGWRGRVGL